MCLTIRSETFKGYYGRKEAQMLQEALWDVGVWDGSGLAKSKR